METKFKLLEPNEIECRVGQGGNNGATWCSLLLYKDARCDMKRLDDVFGTEGWQRRHELIGNFLVCTISIWDAENKHWVEKTDVGTANKTEPEKSTFSDSFKRAATNIGIGRELYTAPKIFINLNPQYDYNKTGRLKTTFHVAYIGYTRDRKINKLIILDNNNYVRYFFGMSEAECKKELAKQNKVEEVKTDAPANTTGNEETDKQLSEAFRQIDKATNVKQLKVIYDSFADLQSVHPFLAKLTEKRTTLEKKTA